MGRDASVGEKAQNISFGKYLLLERIGKGGMAEVFLARPRAQKRLVAIKVIREKLAKDKQYLEMFMREGMLAVQLNHEAIVKTFEIGRVHGRHFICMELISGVDLSHLLRSCRASTNRRLPVPHSLYITLKVCEGLHYAHQLKNSENVSLNVVNRDVSPSNIRISFDGDIKLLDFGIAKATSVLSSEIGVLKGKFAYMSPEQVRGLPLDRRSDVFACGIVLHEMLTQEKLFRGDSDFQLMDLVRRAEVRPPSSINPRVPPDVDAIVLKALQKNLEDRFQTTEEMAGALRSVLVRYNFQKAELRDLVRDVCHREWTNEQQKMEAFLTREDLDAPEQPTSDEDYGEFLEVIEKPDEEKGEEMAPQPQAPLWIWGLLALAALLLAVAVVLLFML
jgi:serine/threonine protein kinase